MREMFSNMMPCIIFLILNLHDVFGDDGDEVKSVSVVVGDFVTLHTDITDIQRDQKILWQFGPQCTPIAEIYKKSIRRYKRKLFGDRLNLDSQTGSLTITNTTITDSGLYELLVNENRTPLKRYNVIVDAVGGTSLPPSSSSSSSSSSKCVLLCLALNLTIIVWSLVDCMEARCTKSG